MVYQYPVNEHRFECELLFSKLVPALDSMIQDQCKAACRALNLRFSVQRFQAVTAGPDEWLQAGELDLGQVFDDQFAELVAGVTTEGMLLFGSSAFSIDLARSSMFYIIAAQSNLRRKYRKDGTDFLRSGKRSGKRLLHKFYHPCWIEQVVQEPLTVPTAPEPAVEELLLQS